MLVKIYNVGFQKIAAERRKVKIESPAITLTSFSMGRMVEKERDCIPELSEKLQKNSYIDIMKRYFFEKSPNKSEYLKFPKIKREEDPDPIVIIV